MGWVLILMIYIVKKQENPNLSDSILSRRISFGPDAVLCYTPTKPSKKSVKRKSITKVVLTEAVRKSPRLTTQSDSPTTKLDFQDDPVKVYILPFNNLFFCFKLY